MLETSSSWEMLNSSEKAICINYAKQLVSGLKIRNALVITVNEIHDKYPDFHMGMVPKKSYRKDFIQEELA